MTLTEVPPPPVVPRSPVVPDPPSAGPAIQVAHPPSPPLLKRLTVPVGFLVIILLAVGLRVWGINATFQTADQAHMSHLVRHQFGLKWIVAHDYGMVLPLIQRGFAEVLWRLHRPYGDAEARLPIAILSLLQIPMTYLLFRRLGRPRGECRAAAVFCTVLTALVCDAYCPWAYRTPWLLAGTTALWATLGWLDDRRWWQLLIAAVALIVHCLSCLYSFALPLTLIAAWRLAWKQFRTTDVKPRRRLLASAAAGFLFPCVLTLGLIVAIWLQTGKGQTGHLLMKQGMGSFGGNLDQVLQLPRAWTGQFGLIFGVIAAGGLFAGTGHLLRRDRRGLLAVWAWAGLLPIVLLTDWDTTGYGANYLLFEVAYAAGLLGILWLASLRYRYARWRPVIAFVSVLAFAQVLLGSVDAIVADTGLQRYTGIEPCWGRVRRDTGVKAAGWYVRHHVPMEAIILSVHDNLGMEVPVAEHYLGRHVLADYDIKPWMISSLLLVTHPAMDVIIVDAGYQPLVDALEGFERTAVFRNRGEPVRYIYARPALGLPNIDADVARLNARFDTEREAHRIPQILPASPRFNDELLRYQALLRVMRSWPSPIP